MTRPEAARAWLDRIGALEWAEKFARERRMTLDELTGTAPRWTRFCTARHEFRAVLLETLDLAYSEMGRGLGIDHTTVMASHAEWVQRSRRAEQVAEMVRTERKLRKVPRVLVQGL